MTAAAGEAMKPPAAAKKPGSPRVILRLVTFPYWQWVMEVVYD